MKPRLTRLSVLVLAMGALSGAVLGVSCTDSSGNGLTTAAGGTGGTTGSGATMSTGGSGGGGLGGLDTDGGSCEKTCSADLKKVVDCYGKTVTECTPEQGCNNAGCIDN